MPDQDSTTEIWKPVVGYEGVYEVSSLGRVKRVAAHRFTKKPITKILRQGRSGRDRRLVVVLTSGPGTRQKQHYVATVVAAAFLGEKPAGTETNHIDGNRDNNRVSNLEYVTHLENVRHAIRLGRMSFEHLRGPKPWTRKLSVEDVVEIKRLLSTGASMASIARRFCVTERAVAHIKYGRTWKHLV